MKFDFSEVVKTKTEAELSDVYINRENYQAEFFEEAHKELLHRGIDLAALDVKRGETLQQEAAVLYEAKDGNPLYLVICFLLALLGGILGIYAGYIYGYSKVHSRQGDYYAYNATTRMYGRIIFYLGIVVVITLFVLKTGLFVL